MRSDYTGQMLLLVGQSALFVFTLYWFWLARFQLSSQVFNVFGYVIAMACIIVSSVHSPHVQYESDRSDQSLYWLGRVYRKFVLSHYKRPNLWLYYAPYIVIPSQLVLVITGVTSSTIILFYNNFEL